MTRVLVVAQSEVMRVGLVACLTAPDLRVVGSSTQGATLANQIETSQPDVLLLELSEEDEWDQLFAAQPSTLAPAIVVVVDELLPAQLAELLRSEVKGILPKSVSAIELSSAVLAAAAGLITLHPDWIETVLPNLGLTHEPNNYALQEADNVARSAIALSAPQGLTLREVEVLQMLAEGISNKQIARRLTISEHTVKFHVSSIFSKLNASSRTEAVRLAVRQGVIFL